MKIRNHMGTEVYKDVDMTKDIVINTQKAKTKPRCKACYPCCMGVVGCDEDKEPHGHGSLQRCPECGVPYAYVHPHSNVCSLGIVVSGDVMHDEHELHIQLEWTKNRVLIMENILKKEDD